ncbi:hypothetical protein H5P28_17335 [Ruficoccus amylovorans]|uniref:Uncharacterized protein n=1 Tax=Ruficoccus amylovorans TaxID=1804625 RepID=A0A842HHM9_9BACT|nr:hypothetical protein [Ruficoccus amylovorans]MBC2596033.1 hypothetical protein [Ruficoccus amylovorans]
MSVRTLTLTVGLLVGLLVSFTLPVAAELEPSSISFRIGMRYNTQFDKDTMDQRTGWLQYRGQISYALGLLSSPAGDFTLRGIAGTGRSYTSSWNSFVSTVGQTVPDQVFNMRQIYLQDNFEGWTGQIGVIPPNGDNIPTLGYDVDGWVRGGRVTAPLGEGRLQLVTGAIDHLSDPNAFQTWNEWNYFGAILEQPLPWWELRGGLSYEYLADQNYVGAEIARQWTLDEGMTLTGALEALHNFTTPTWAWAAAARLRTSPVTVGVAYTYINPNFGLRGELSDDFFTLGHRLSINFGGEALVKDWRWFVNTDVAEQLVRFRIGFNYTFGASEPGYLAIFD